MTVEVDEALAADSLVGMTLSGYRIERLLGAGGMGLVYLARHEFIDRRFAVKALKPEVAADEQMARSFLREAQVLSTLKHPNIVDIVGFGGLPDGRQYMVMEFLEGHTLEEEMLQGRLSLSRTLRVADQVLHALDAAHGAGVVHRDLKPSNVFLARGSGGVEVIKLLDFGLARQQPIALIPSGEIVDGPGAAVPVAAPRNTAGQTMIAGTPDYIAPEQAQGMTPGPGCDIYSFGVMLFELLAGRRPFDPPPTGDRATALLRAHLFTPAPTLEEFDVQAPAAVSELVTSCLQKKPEERPLSAAIVRERLDAVRVTLSTTPLPLTNFATPSMRLDAEDAASVQQRSWKLPIAIAALAALILTVVLWPRGDAAPIVPPEEVKPVVVEKTQQEIDELNALSKIAVKTPAVVKPIELPPPPPPEVKPVEPEPQPKLVVAPKKTVVGVYQSDCEPDDRWKAATLVNVQELQTLAGGDDKRWAEFQRLEPKLTGAINNANTGEECAAVEQQIRRLATRWK